MSEPPMIFAWNGSAMVPVHPHIPQNHFTIGERYRFEIIEERSLASHNHYFACLHDIWVNLPESQSERFPTAEHMRKYALIKCGYADERSIVCASYAEARRFAAFVKPMDSFAIVLAEGAVVRVFTAKSQSKHAMGNKVFQDSKQAVLDWCADLIGITRNEIEKCAGHSA